MHYPYPILSTSLPGGCAYKEYLSRLAFEIVNWKVGVATLGLILFEICLPELGNQRGITTKCLSPRSCRLTLACQTSPFTGSRYHRPILRYPEHQTLLRAGQRATLVRGSQAELARWPISVHPIGIPQWKTKFSNTMGLWRACSGGEDFQNMKRHLIDPSNLQPVTIEASRRTSSTCLTRGKRLLPRYPR